MGIGANSVVFSIVDVLMLHPLQFERSDRLVNVYGVSNELALTNRGLSIPDFTDLREQTVTMDVAGWLAGSFNLSGGAIPERVSALKVSANFFQGGRFKRCVKGEAT